MIIELHSDRACDPSLVGAKAARLAMMARAGFSVPEGRIVTGALSTEERDALFGFVRSSGGVVVVRTSARLEDGVERSYAGVYESRVATDVDLEAALAAVQDHARRVQDAGRAPREGPVALLVQRRIAGAGGVYLSRDPAGAGHLLQMAPGGARLVTSGSSVTSSFVSPADRASALALSKAVEGAERRAVDVELAVEQGKAYLLQVRPQTAARSRGRNRGGWSRSALAPYFPLPVAPLVGEVWASLLSRHMGIEVRVRRWLLESRGEPREGRSTARSPDEAVRAWDRHCRRALSSLVGRIRAAERSWTDAHAAFSALIELYFNNPVVVWIEEARKEIAEVACRPTIRRLRAIESLRRAVQDDPRAAACAAAGDVAGILRFEGPVAAALRSYLARYGHCSEHPDDFGRPYPADEPDLLAPWLATSCPLWSTSPRCERPKNVWARLLEIGEVDNASKHRACSSLRRSVLALGASLAEQGVISSPDLVWTLRLEDIVRARRTKARVARRQPAAAVLDRRTLWFGEPLSPGVARGIVWRGDGPPPEGDVVLVCPVLGPAASMWLGRVVGLVSAAGGRASHGAIVARETGRPAVSSAEAASSLMEGEWITVDGFRGVVRRGEGQA